ncbi:MAG: DNA replication/repair protein RecF [Patescibacteria group bacterium]
MLLKQLRLSDFRNYSQKEFSFSEGTTLIVGPNTSGKTNLLEGIYLLATGKSFRAGLESEMIAYDQDLSRVKGRILNKGRTDLEIILTRGEVLGEKVAKKKYQVNGISKRAVDFVGKLRAVYFGPEDLDLVTNSPSLRRKYLDSVLSQVDREYSRSALSYEKGLRQRNRLLERIRDEGASRSQLLFWNQLLIKNGEYITRKREEFIEFINSVQYSVFSFKLEYDKSIISPARLEDYAEEEVAAGVTLVGPHRDDFTFTHPVCDRLTHRDLSAYGSRGEQRLSILWLKLAELEFISEKVGERPILLLDDIFSELDKKHRKLVLEIIPSQQTIITTTDLDLVEKEYQKQKEVVKLGQ